VIIREQNNQRLKDQLRNTMDVNNKPGEWKKVRRAETMR
jgi:hypothetical protein